MNGSVRYLFEMLERTTWEPLNALSTSYNSLVSVVSYFECGAPETSYWIDWGGRYDNPPISSVALFLDEYFKRVESIDLVLSNPKTFFVSGNLVYFSTELYPWQYQKTLFFLSTMRGFSSAGSNVYNNSDDTVSGVRYPARLIPPVFGNSEIPDPINGVMPMPATTIILYNDDGYFDSIDPETVLNSPVKIKRSSVESPSITDFNVIRTGVIDDITITFSEIKFKIVDPIRSFTQEVCKVITDDQFPGVKEDSIDKKMPIVYGEVFGISLIGLFENTNEYLACDPDYLTNVQAVYNSDGVSIQFVVNPSGTITTQESASTADITGNPNDCISEIISSEISMKTEIPFNDAHWDIEEYIRYSTICEHIGVFFSGGTLRKFIENCLENDTAFLFCKNDGRLTIRRWGIIYESHSILPWMITQQPTRTFTDQKFFCSSIQLNYQFSYKKDGCLKSYLYNARENEVFEKYTKRQLLTYDTKLYTRDTAISLAERLFSRQSSRNEMLRLAVAYDTYLINPIDTVMARIEINDRLFTTKIRWIVRSCDASQDVIELEESQFFEDFNYGYLSHPSTSDVSGVASFPTINGVSGITSMPFSAKE